MLQKEMLITETESIKDTLKQLDRCAEKVLLVVDKRGRLLGAITDGDIRRYILAGKSLDTDISEVYNRKPTFIRKSEFSTKEAKKILIKRKIELLPVVDDDNKVVDFVTWKEVFSEDTNGKSTSRKLCVPVVIMAGGKGTRLEPFTTILPKPLIPIKDKPIIEIIIDKFRDFGIKDYYLTLNYKGEMIEAYFKHIDKDYTLHYVWEEDFWGTGGSLKLLEDEIADTFIVSNCDVIVKADFEEVVHLHKKQNASMTVLSSIQHYKIPYGVINFKNGGRITDILEKPEYTFTINTGVYVLSREVLRYIPERSHFDMTDLMTCLLKHHKKVVTYPVNENEYVDIGQWEEYRRAVDKLHI
ncbi:MAG: nucleotidyltransferase family protein [Nitrospirota bacterium]